MKIFLIIAIVLIILILAVVIVSVKLLNMTVYPKKMSIEGEKDYIKQHGMWGSFDSLDSEKYTVEGINGYLLHCELLSDDKTRNSNKYVIISHGYTSNRYGTLKYTDSYISLGFNCIVYDLRGHGENDRAACTIGNFEARDLMRLISDTYSRYGDDIFLGLHGESMGSSTSINSLRYRPKVKFVVADCCFADLYELLKPAFKQKHVTFLLPVINTIMKLLYGCTLHDTSAIKAIQGNTIPVCFIHGSEDDFITPSNSEALSKATSGYSEIHLIPKAGHAQCREIIGEGEYTDIIRLFLSKVSEQIEET